MSDNHEGTDLGAVRQSVPEAADGSAEDRLIAKYFRPIATHPGAFGLADDAAAVAPPPGCDIVLTTDGIIGGVHFFPDDPADAVARKALRINLSDLAAKGAAPLGFLLSIALPAELAPGWLEGFARGLREDAASYGAGEAVLHSKYRHWRGRSGRSYVFSVYAPADCPPYEDAATALNLARKRFSALAADHGVR